MAADPGPVGAGPTVATMVPSATDLVVAALDGDLAALRRAVAGRERPGVLLLEWGDAVRIEAER